MARNVFRDLQKQVQQMASEQEMQKLYQDCCKELAARFLRKVMKRTPVGKGSFEVVRDKDGTVKKYKRGKNKGKGKLKRLTNGGTLRRGWAAKTYEEAKSGKAPNVMEAVDALQVARKGRIFEIRITNVVPYASFVELGHRQEPGRFVPVLGKRLKNGWVEGQFMMKISSEELAAQAPAVLRKKFQEWLEGRLGR
ncbi:MAG: HK97 gp10 family phage protein [Selenomonadaceae bacterium]|nr:HK97 gp10 family phage protein [Selenomonadaceae bacterium]